MSNKMQNIEFNSNLELSVDREGGKWKSGVIRNFAVMTLNVEALGHDLFVDETFGEEVAQALQTKYGIKSRLTHVKGDGIAAGLGRVFYSKTEGGKVFGDLHFWASAHKSPSGNLADFVMTKAEEDPQAFGSSIGFSRDISREEWNDDIPRVRLAELKYVDIVDSPATNPEGLFSGGHEVSQAIVDMLNKLTTTEIELMKIVMNGSNAMKTDTTPLGRPLPVAEVVEDAPVVEEAVEAPVVAEEAPEATEEPKVEEATTETPVEETPAEEPTEAPEAEATEEAPEATEEPVAEEAPAEPVVEEAAPEAAPEAPAEPVAEAAPAVTKADLAAELKGYTEMFGAHDGQELYFGGVSMADAQAQFIAKQAAEIKTLKNKLDVEMTSTESVGQAGELRTSPKGFASNFSVN